MANRGRLPPRKLKDAVQKLVKTTTLEDTAKKLGLSIHTTKSLAGGLPVTSGTIAQAEKALGAGG